MSSERATGGLSRRDLLATTLVSPLWAAVASATTGQSPVQSVRKARSMAMGPDGAAVSGLEVECEWQGPICRSRVTNPGATAVRVRDVTLFDVELALPAQSALYGEGFQMLSQTGGTIASPADLGNYTDAKHYRLPIPEGTRAFYGLLTLIPPAGDATVFAFTSCARFSGRFELRGGHVRAVVDTEGLELAAGESWPLEELFVSEGFSSRLLDDVGNRLARNHPPLKTAAPPSGWCSWYCFGPSVTARQVLDNLDVIAARTPQLKYVQIDDGYQRAMGDWLETGSAFGGSVRQVLDEIRRRGFEPAIWVAPFVAEVGSNVFQQHPAWFIKDDAGAPLRSDRVTFGGWRRGPWYALDGTHPEVQDHFERVFRTMRDDWGCTYFKLDANFWGAMHGGRFADPRATRIEAYRRGMAAILRGTRDAFVLGCNHPLWPSIGVIHGSRSSNDIKRTWDRVATTARQNLSRNWQNGRLWWNDPDAVVLSGDLTDDEFQFHATAIYASGGMVLSGDDLTTLPPARMAMLRALLPPTGVAAVFEDERLIVGSVSLADRRMVCLFNWTDRPSQAGFRLTTASHVTDVWSGAALGRREGLVSLELAAHGARLLECR
jgi:alpha-galactosidase